MRYSEISEDEFLFEYSPDLDPVTFSEKALAKAEADGFDTTRIWYHGTTKSFTDFRVGRGGIDELGKGIYVTKLVGRANVWAQGGGTIYACVLREGKLLELSELPLSGLWHEGNVGYDKWQIVHQAHSTYLEKNFGEGSAYEYRDFADLANKGKLNFAEFMPEMGYIGATSRYSQIKGQAVIWDPADIRIVGKTSGFAGWAQDDDENEKGEGFAERG